MGVTHTLRSSRRSETGRIADLEKGTEGGTVPLRTYGPYRSAYGRLCEFPHLPPVLVRATRVSSRGGGEQAPGGWDVLGADGVEELLSHAVKLGGGVLAAPRVAVAGP